MPLERALAAARRDLRRARAQLLDQRLHPRAPPRERLGAAVDGGEEERHGASVVDRAAATFGVVARRQAGSFGSSSAASASAPFIVSSKWRFWIGFTQRTIAARSFSFAFLFIVSTIAQ